MRPHDATGLVEYYAERRIRYAGLAYVPPPVVRDVPVRVALDDAERQTLTAKIDELKEQLSAAVQENLHLQAMVAEFKPGNVPPPNARVAVKAVQDAFCEAMNAANRTAAGVPWSVEHLKSPRRCAEFTHPRHVCMWLCKRLCVGVSLPQIGRAFGGRDHTTALHAQRRAIDHMIADPDLHTVALLILQRFNCSAPIELGEKP